MKVPVPQRNVRMGTTGIFDPCDLDGLLAPPTKKAKREWVHASLPGIKPEIAKDHELMIRWRHDIHRHPELGFEEHRTSDMVARLLRTWGIEVTVGAVGGPTAVIGVLKGKSASDRCIGLRADMDALPTQEVTSNEYKSTRDGSHHGCGHDGHTTMLLGAAKHLASTRNFSGTVTFIFQPNEEATGEFTGPRIEFPDGQSGGELMVRQGLFSKFPCDQIYGLHTWPALAAGTVGVKAGALSERHAKRRLTLYPHPHPHPHPHPLPFTLTLTLTLTRYPHLSPLTLTLTLTWPGSAALMAAPHPTRMLR